jgi:hypothetical protein
MQPNPLALADSLENGHDIPILHKEAHLQLPVAETLWNLLSQPLCTLLDKISTISPFSFRTRGVELTR